MSMMDVLETSTISKLIQSKGLQTWEDLAAATGINRYTLSQIMQGGRRVVRRDTKSKIVDYLAKYQPA